MARKIGVEKTAGLKIRTGNYETIEVSESIRMDIEFESVDELKKKDEVLTSLLISLLRKTAEDVMSGTSKHRIVGNQAVELWDDTEQGAKAKE